MQNRSNHSTDNSINVGHADGSAIVSGTVNGNITTNSNSTHQSGSFGVGVNNGEIHTDTRLKTNEAPSSRTSQKSGTPSPQKVLVDAVDHAQRFTFGWQFFAIFIGLLMAILTGVGTQIDFDNLQPKPKEQTTQQEPAR
jgi:hypothetical protein